MPIKEISIVEDTEAPQPGKVKIAGDDFSKDVSLAAGDTIEFHNETDSEDPEKGITAYLLFPIVPSGCSHTVTLEPGAVHTAILNPGLEVPPELQFKYEVAPSRREEKTRPNIIIRP